MRTFTLLLVALPALAAQQATVTTLLPPSGDPALQPLALLIGARASELAEETGKVSELHLKQVLRVMDDEGFTDDLSTPANDEALRLALGADRAVWFTLEGAGSKLVLTGTVAEEKKKPRTFKTSVPTDWPTALEKGSLEVARALLGKVPTPKKSQAQPRSTSEEALRALGACYAVVLKQPVSVDTPALLDAAELQAAAAQCDHAAELDPSLRFASATASLAHAILGTDASAVKALTALGREDDLLELSTLARFWLLTRYQSNEAGVAFLEDVVTRHPGELLARGYLGDTQFALADWAGAEATWREYLVAAPASPWAWGRLSKALARQGRHDDALAAARKGFALSPTSPEARLELGSRLIDAGKSQEAEEILQPLADVPAPRGEHLLRLGWAHWLQGELEPAQAYFQRAFDVATRPGEWRTRGRAQYDLALVEQKRGRKDAAKAALQRAEATGFRLREPDPSLKPLLQELARAEIAAPTQPRPDAPKEANLFPLDAAGVPDTTVKRPEKAPDGLVLFKF